jgi:hypothetical protein
MPPAWSNAFQPGPEDELAPFPWVPTDRTTGVPVGAHWDAVRVPPKRAEDAYRLLGPSSGPIVANDYAGVWFFLLERGASRGWSVRGTRVPRPASLVAIPPLWVTHGGDARWIVAPGAGLTDPADLEAALHGRAPAMRASRARRRTPARTSAVTT